MKLSSKVFLLSADDTLHALASTAFMRMLRQEDLTRVPTFAGQRVRQASVVVQVVDGTPWRMVHSTFSILEIKPDGFLDVDRLNTQQIARLDVKFDRSRPADEVGRGPSSTLPRDLLLGAALGSLTRAYCAASKPRRWDGCRVHGFDCFGDALEARQLIDSEALRGVRFHAKRIASGLDLNAYKGSFPGAARDLWSRPTAALQRRPLSAATAPGLAWDWT